MLLTRKFALAVPILGSLLLPAAFAMAWGQTPSPANKKLALKAALVLTQDFCATTKKTGNTGNKLTSYVETFEIGKAACAELEPALQGTFESLTRLTAMPSDNSAQVVLLPKFVDANATRPVGITIFDRPA